jgi:acetyltransferase-like isoleucine patch superfamily enzyme
MVTKVYETAKVCERTELLMDDKTVIGDFNFVSCARLKMMEGAQTNRHVCIEGRGSVTLGRYSTIANHVSILTSTDTPYGIMNDQAEDELRHVKTGDIVIGDYAFIGQGSVIMPGVTVGNGAVVGAFSFVTSDVRPWHIMHPVKPLTISVFRLVDVPLPNYPLDEMEAAKKRIWEKGG